MSYQVEGSSLKVTSTENPVFLQERDSSNIIDNTAAKTIANDNIHVLTPLKPSAIESTIYNDRDLDLQSIDAEFVQDRLGRLCTINKDNALKSSDYFHSNPLLNLSSEELQSNRPKKYQYLKESFRDNEEYLNLKKNKEEIYEALEAKLINNKPAALQNLLIDGIETGKSFEALFLPKFGKEYVREEQELKALYESIGNNNSKEKKYADPKNFINPQQLTKEQKQLLEGEKKPPKLFYSSQKEDIAALDDIFKLISSVLQDPEKLEIVWQKALENDGYKMPFTFTGAIRGFLIPKGMEKTADKSLTQQCNSGEFRFICALIRLEMLKDIKAEKKGPDALIEYFDKNQAFIEEYCKTQVERDLVKIRALMKEQKQHSFARFCQLSTNYENFLRHAKIIENMAEKMEPGAGIKTRHIIRELVSHSHYGPRDEKIAEINKRIVVLEQNLEQARINGASQSEIVEEIQLKKEKLRKEQTKKNLLTVDDTHHNKSIMGYEVKGRYKAEDVERAVQKSNTIMQLHRTKHTIRNLQRAHTFPFPAMFNWKEKKIKEITNAYGIKVDESFQPVEKMLSSSFFKDVVLNSSISLEYAKSMDDEFKKEVLQIAKDFTDPGEFVVSAISLLKQHHLRVFSETQYFPDFINQDLDQLSEWSTKDGDYKKCLAQNIATLLDQESVTLDDVKNQLESYMLGIAEKINIKNEEWEKEKTTLDMVKMIGGIQVQQSYIAGAMNTDFLKTSALRNNILSSK